MWPLTNLQIDHNVKLPQPPPFFQNACSTASRIFGHTESIWHGMSACKQWAVMSIGFGACAFAVQRIVTARCRQRLRVCLWELIDKETTTVSKLEQFLESWRVCLVGDLSNMCLPLDATHTPILFELLPQRRIEFDDTTAEENRRVELACALVRHMSAHSQRFADRVTSLESPKKWFNAKQRNIGLVEWAACTSALFLRSLDAQNHTAEIVSSVSPTAVWSILSCVPSALLEGVDVNAVRAITDGELEILLQKLCAVQALAVSSNKWKTILDHATNPDTVPRDPQGRRPVETIRQRLMVLLAMPRCQTWLRDHEVQVDLCLDS